MESTKDEIKYERKYGIHLIYEMANLKSIEEITKEWGTDLRTFSIWVKEYEEFKKHFEVGKRLQEKIINLALVRNQIRRK